MFSLYMFSYDLFNLRRLVITINTAPEANNMVATLSINNDCEPVKGKVFDALMPATLTLVVVDVDVDVEVLAPGLVVTLEGTVEEVLAPGLVVTLEGTVEEVLAPGLVVTLEGTVEEVLAPGLVVTLEGTVEEVLAPGLVVTLEGTVEEVLAPGLVVTLEGTVEEVLAPGLVVTLEGTVEEVLAPGLVVTLEGTVVVLVVDDVEASSQPVPSVPGEHATSLVTIIFRRFRPSVFELIFNSLFVLESKTILLSVKFTQRYELSVLGKFLVLHVCPTRSETSNCAADLASIQILYLLLELAGKKGARRLLEMIRS
jgi:hypothetical protein